MSRKSSTFKPCRVCAFALPSEWCEPCKVRLPEVKRSRPQPKEVKPRRKRGRSEAARLRKLEYNRAYLSNYSQTESGAAVIRRNDRIRRARKRGANVLPFTELELKAWFEQFGGSCAYCDRPCPQPTQDHVIPLSKGGAHALSNLLPVCLACNLSKASSDLLAWYSKQPYYSRDRYIDLISLLQEQEYREEALYSTIGG